MSLFSWLFSRKVRTDEQKERFEAYKKQLKDDMQADLIAAGMGHNRGHRRAQEEKWLDFYGTVRTKRVTIKRKEQP